MNKEEFIGKLEMVYVGDRNAFNEIVEDNQKLKNELVYSKVEIERLNNIINGLEEYIKPYLYMLNGIQDRDIYEQCQLDDFTDIMDKLKKLKENKEWN